MLLQMAFMEWQQRKKPQALWLSLVPMHIDTAVDCSVSMGKATCECLDAPSSFDTFPSGSVGRLKELMNKSKSRLMHYNTAQ